MNTSPIPDFAAPPLGQHLIAEFHGATHLFHSAPAERVLRDAAHAAGASVLDVRLHDFGDRHGFTGVALLAESHISIHTWPEHDYAAIDIFMCGEACPEDSLEVLRAWFRPERGEVHVLKRGTLVSPVMSG